GYWTGVRTSDAGQSWQGDAMSNMGNPAQIAAVSIAPTGTALAVGYYNYVGHAGSDGTFARIETPSSAQWYNAVATATAGNVWVVGEAGTILHSADDGLTFALQSAPTSEDLYAIAFADATTGIAVGAHGAAVITHDGGATWEDDSTGLDGFL